MVIWQAIHTDTSDGRGASYHETKSDAIKALREAGDPITEVSKMSITNRGQLADALNGAIGHGGT